MLTKQEREMAHRLGVDPRHVELQAARNARVPRGENPTPTSFGASGVLHHGDPTPLPNTPKRAVR